MNAPWLKEKGDRHVDVVRTRGRRSGMDDPVRFDRLVGPTVWGDGRSSCSCWASRWPYRRCSRSWYPPFWARCRAHAPLTERLSQFCLRSMSIHGSRLCHSRAECWGSSSAQARDAGASRAFRRRSTDERARIGRSQDDAVRSPRQVTRAGIARTVPTRRLTRARSRAAPETVSSMTRPS